MSFTAQRNVSKIKGRHFYQPTYRGSETLNDKHIYTLINLLFMFSFAECLPARYVLAVLGSIGMAIVYGLKVNLSVAMVAMLNHTAVGHGSHGGGAQMTNLTDHETDYEVCLPPGGAGDSNGTSAKAAVIKLTIS